MNKINDKDYIPLTPFKGWVIENFPFIEADFDAITNYELICQVTKYLNDVISNQNQVEELGSELVQGYNDLVDYVNNLDLQEQVNNKLDEMALDGTLTNLIKGYIDPIQEEFENSIINRQNNYESALSGRVDYLADEVSAVASGSPHGVYETLLALQTDDPDHDYIYVVLADGKWYYFDTTENDWVAGGVYQAVENSDKVNQLYMNMFGGSEINPYNVLPDATMETAEALDESTTITDSVDTPSKQINIESTTGDNVGASVSTGDLFNPMVSGTYYIHVTVKFSDNSESTGQTPFIDIYNYLNSSLKGSQRLYLTASKKGEWVDYYIEKTFSPTASNFNKFHIYASAKYDFEIKNLFILAGTNNDLGYYITYKNILKSDKKLSIIGDSLSAVNDTADKKYWYYLQNRDGYTIDNVAISGAGYYNGSNYQGTNDHQFYNQAQNIANDTDMVLIFGSFNDISKLYAGDVTIGTISDTGTNTIYGCINNTINNLLTINPELIIGAVLPTPWNGMYAGVPDANPYKQYVFAYIECLKNAYEYHSIPYLDLWHESNLRPWIASVRSTLYYNSDGVHPNNKGHLNYIYPHIKEFIKTLDEYKYI